MLSPNREVYFTWFWGLEVKKLSLLVLLAAVGCKSHPVGDMPVYAETDLPHWAVTDLGTGVLKDPYPTSYGYLVVDGFWVPTNERKKLPFPLAVKIECDRSEGVCREIGAQVSFGVLVPSMEEYRITSWTRSSVVADDETTCQIGHRLTVSLTAKSVTVVDYPTTAMGAHDNKFCKALNDASSYVLHDGAILLDGSVPFDQSNVRK